MRKNKIRKLLLIMACAAATLSAGMAIASCGGSTQKSDVSFVEDEVEKKGPQFLEGALANIHVNERIVLDEYVEYVEDVDFTLTMTDENGNVEDITKKRIWYTRESGTYTMTYTIEKGKYKGTSTFTFYVTYPELWWEFSLKNMPYKYGETLSFEEYFEAMNIYTSLPDCEVKMESVEVDGEKIDLLDAEGYTFASRSDHTFKFFAESPDGQRCEGSEIISIKYIDEDYQQELTDMGISLYGDLYVERGNFTLVEGSYCNGNNVIYERKNGPHNLPYIAYNGDYGIGDYVKIDFTGNNMPIFSFFRDSYTENIHDGTKGFIFTGGFKNNFGAPIHPTKCKEFNIYGPYMLHKYDTDKEDTRSWGGMVLQDGQGNAIPYPGSMESLQDGTKYRMIAGFSGIRKGSSNLIGTNTPVDTIFLDFDCVIINLDTKEIVTKFRIDTYGIQACGFDKIPLETENNPFFNGNIVLYGNHGERTVWDKIYPIIEDTTFDAICEEELTFSSFKPNAPNFFLDAEAELKVSDFVDTSAEGYKFFYRDEEGNTYNVEGDTFVLGKTGSYTFYYTDGVNLCATMGVFVANFSEEVLQWVQDNNISLYGLESLTDEKVITLKAGTIKDGGTYGGPNSGDHIDQGYLALNGEYGINDYLAFEFTGKNMPEVAFFAQNYNNSMYAQNGGKQGVLFANGITSFNGGLQTGILGDGTKVNIDSPFMMQSIDTWFVKNGMQDSKLARANLDDNTHYRVILGFNKHDAAGIEIKWYLYNLDEDTVVEQSSIQTWNFFTGDNAKVENMTLDDLVGSIVLYGKFGTTLTIDKLHGVYENTSIDEVIKEFNKNTQYKVEFKDADGKVLQSDTLLYGTMPQFNGEIPTLDKADDEWFTYVYDWDKKITPVTGHTVYTLVEVARPKGDKDFKDVTIDGDTITLGAGNIGAGADYTKGQNAGGSITQSYFAYTGDYGFDNYIVFDFTGKNMPEVMFFAKNYDTSMYYSKGKQGIVVASGITLWDGSTGSAQSGNTQVGVSGPFGAYFEAAAAPHGGNMLGDFNAKLARANLVDGTQYRIVMGITKAEDSRGFTLKYMLYNLTDNVVVETVEQTSWLFFDGENPMVNNMTLDGLSGAIVLYGKFNTTCKIDKLHGVVNGDFATVVEQAKAL